MRRLQSVIYAAAAKCEQCSGSARLGSVEHGRARSSTVEAMGWPFRSPYIWVAPTVARPTRARQGAKRSNRPTMRHRVTIRDPAQYWAQSLPVRSKACTIREPQGAVVPVVYPIALKTLTTLDLLGISPIAAGIAQLLTACAVAVLWAVAVADWLTADQRRQVQLLRIAGHTQASISRRLGVSRYAVRKALA